MLAGRHHHFNLNSKKNLLSKRQEVSHLGINWHTVYILRRAEVDSPVWRNAISLGSVSLCAVLGMEFYNEQYSPEWSV